MSYLAKIVSLFVCSSDSHEVNTVSCTLNQRPPSKVEEEIWREKNSERATRDNVNARQRLVRDAKRVWITSNIKEARLTVVSF